MSTNLSGMNREVYSVPGGSVKTINFNGTDPNYFHIQNNGNGAVYFSAHGIPTKKLYDMKIDGGSISTFADPYPQSEIYIFNPLEEECNIILTTFKAPFDPAVLAQANRQLTISGTVETDGIIKGFESPLPAGTNKIGSVDVNSVAQLSKGAEFARKVYAIPDNQNLILSAINEIKNKLDNLEFTAENLTVNGTPESNWVFHSTRFVQALYIRGTLVRKLKLVNHTDNDLELNIDSAIRISDGDGYTVRVLEYPESTFNGKLVRAKETIELYIDFPISRKAEGFIGFDNSCISLFDYESGEPTSLNDSFYIEYYTEEHIEENV